WGSACRRIHDENSRSPYSLCMMNHPFRIDFCAGIRNSGILAIYLTKAVKRGIMIPVRFEADVLPMNILIHI
ncbi:MAG: hypothetical protein IJ334_15220, partial [Clostridia bacterium]|nr:hypothetical protein [Clostridia bacterium]